MATANQILLEIVTPKGVVLSEQVDELVAPSVDGEFGVLVGHLPILAALRTGLVRYRIGTDEQIVGVGGGFVEVVKDKALLLTDRYVLKEEVDVLNVRERLKEVDDELGAWEGELRDPHRLELIEEEQWLAAQLELIGDPPVPTVLETSRRLDFGDIIPGGEDAESSEQESEAAD